METITALCKTLIDEEKIIQMVLSNVKKGVEKTYQKVEIKPVLIKERYLYHVSYFYEQKVKHENLDGEALMGVLSELLGAYFKQGVIFTSEQDYQILFSKKGKGTLLKKAPTKFGINLSHNREKNYILKEGTPCDFLEALGVMDASGKVYKKKYDKYRQLNKYLEFVEDALDVLKSENGPIKIIDFGCGKAYLTFALYHYLVTQKGLEVEIIGLDLKEDVIEYCNQVAKDLKYTGLRFELGDIKDYKYKGNVDMVVSLHACDTATDEALGKACAWHAKVIFAVPCCQHELFNQIEQPNLEPLLRHGIIRDKFATLVTDTLRMTALEVMSYETQMLEFIDLEHTPKNILIRAYLKDKTKADEQVAVKTYVDYRNYFSVKPHIEKALGQVFHDKLHSYNDEL
ncbi:class I SAM-dependent methyltransferase [Fusibacter ferrireducens]|uniref:SAM-dependent methyltransferase n=1 Tax=Fusibacter ferrireducens TaxID=2785058 RepID=A0ABR9ZS59_9FIRM|nr:SAM-dependent methyltransferase [Fusibacter ferrireducens]MBF4693287.1 SAM-dependent methyltransferase [Fusibacter ferrireducens]